MTDKCKRCGIKTVLTDEDIDKMIKQVRGMRGIRLTDEKSYNERVAVCSECEKLVYGSTCSACGCVIRVRALTADGRCPKRKWV